MRIAPEPERASPAPKLDPYGPTFAERLAREVSLLAGAQPGRAAMLLVAQGRIAADVKDDLALAEQAVTTALTLSPDTRFVAQAYRWLAERRGAPRLLIGALRAELALVREPRERAGLLFSIARVERDLGNESAAIKALEEAAQLAPHEPSGWLALATLHARRSEWKEATAAWAALANTIDEPLLRAAAHANAGAWLENHVGDSDRAEAAYTRALADDPGHLGAQAGLSGLLLRRRAWGEYARWTMAQAEQADDPAFARAYFERAGDVQLESIGDVNLAVACFERASAAMPKDVHAAFRLAQALEMAGRWEALASALARVVELTELPEERALALVRLASVLERQLGRAEEARTHYERALETAPTCEVARLALVGAYRRLGLWEDVVRLEMLDAERVAEARGRSSRYAAVAELVESQLGDVERAVKLYERALDLDPANTAAFDALDRIHRATAEWERVIVHYERLLGSARDPRRIRATKIELALLLQGRVSRPARASELLTEVLEAPGADDSFPVLIALARANADAGKWAEYVEVLEKQAALLSDAEEQVATLHRVGVAVDLRLREPGRALSIYRRLLERSPTHEPTLRAACRASEDLGNWEAVIEFEKKLAAVSSRAEDVAARWRRIAHVYETELGRLDLAIEALETSLEKDPRDRTSAWALERLLRSEGAYDRLAARLLADSANASGTEVALRCGLAAATVLELHLGDTARALTTYAQLLERTPENVPALAGLARIQLVRKDWKGLAATLTRLAEAARRPNSTLGVLVSLARVQEFALGDRERALALYAEALEERGDLGLAVDRLRIAQNSGDTAGLAGAVSAVADGVRSPVARSAFLAWRGRLLEEVGDSETAKRAFDLALETRPQTPDVLDAVARALFARAKKDTERAPDEIQRPLGEMAATFRARARTVGDAPTRTQLAFVAGALLEQAGTLRDAEAAYSEALEAEPKFIPALYALRRLRAESGDWAHVADLAGQIAQASVDRENSAEAWLDAGDILSQRLHSPAEALSRYRTLLDAQPGHSLALERALPIVETLGDHSLAVAMLKAHATAVTDPEARSRCLERRALLLSDRLSRFTEAVADLEEACRLRPADVTIATTLARLYERERAWQSAAQIWERIERTAPSPAERRAAALSHARIFSDELLDYGKARSVLEALTQTDPLPEVRLRLAEVATRAGDPARAIELHRLVAAESQGDLRIDSMLATCELEQGRSNSEAAESALLEALRTVLAQPSGHARVVEVGQRCFGARRLAALMEKTLDQGRVEAPGVLALRLATAKLHADDHQFENAERHLAAAITGSPKAVEARLALARVSARRNEDRALGELRTAIELDVTSPEIWDALVDYAERAKLHRTASLLATGASLLGSSREGTLRALETLAPPHPGGSLPHDLALALLVGPTRARLLRGVLDILDPYLHVVFPGGDDTLSRLPEVAASYSVVADVRQAARALGVDRVAIHRGAGREVGLLLTEPRAIVLGSQYLGDGARRVAMFHAGYALARVAGRSGLGHALPHDEALALIEAITLRESNHPLHRELKKRAHAALPRKSRKDLEKWVSETHGDIHREMVSWEEEEKERAVRVATLVAGDLRDVAQIVAPEVAQAQSTEERVRLLAQHAFLLNLLRFVASDACWQAHGRLFGSNAS